MKFNNFHLWKKVIWTNLPSTLYSIMLKVLIKKKNQTSVCFFQHLIRSTKKILILPDITHSHGLAPFFTNKTCFLLTDYLLIPRLFVLIFHTVWNLLEPTGNFCMISFVFSFLPFVKPGISLTIFRKIQFARHLLRLWLLFLICQVRIVHDLP